MIKTNLLLKSPHIKTLRTTDKIIMMPPIVGVPSFFRWVCGPSSLTYCVMLSFLSFPIIHGADIKVMIKEVIIANAVLNVIYLNTLNGE
jgi:hypothetical protein